MDAGQHQHHGVAVQFRVGRLDLGRFGIGRMRHIGRVEVAGHEASGVGVTADDEYRGRPVGVSPWDRMPRHVMQHPRKVAACGVFEFLERHSGQRRADCARLLRDQHVGGRGPGAASNLQDGHRGRAAVHLHPFDAGGHPQSRWAVEDS